VSRSVRSGGGVERRVIRVAGKQGGERAGSGCWVVGVGRKPAPARGTAASGAARADRPGTRLRERWRKPVLTLEQLVEGRVEHRPAGSCCAECRHLGALVRVTDAAGLRRWRRLCARAARALTQPDWPACEGFEALGIGR
jgi:hypothetical protein